MNTDDDTSGASTDDGHLLWDDEFTLSLSQAAMIMQDLKRKRAEIDSAISTLLATYPELQQTQAVLNHI